jgi:hypothetical protein
MSLRADDGTMPGLDAFDDEFGREDGIILSDTKRTSGFRLSTIIGLALAAGIISALALGWPNTSGPLLPKLQTEAASSTDEGEKLNAAISRLAREVEDLKTENRQLRQAQQEASETIASLQSRQQDNGAAFATWYSDLAPLIYTVPTQSEAVASSRRSATARPKPREARRDESGPISLDPAQ